MSQMDADVQKRIRALGGNTVCADCENINPQWASISYGCLLCLECSGHHRSLGVHLSFVRSLAMDSWTQRQIQAMEKSGGNQKLVDFFESKGIKKELKIATKYNTKQAQYFRDRLTRQLEGRTEPPPDPGRYDPVTGGSDAQGAEPLPGETTEQYNIRQAKLKDAARERMRAKFGDSGMCGLGQGSPEEQSGGGVGDLLGGVGSFLNDKVIQNERLRGAVGGVAGGIGAGYNGLKESERFGGAVNTVGGWGSSLLGKIGVGGDGSPQVNLQNGKTLAQQEKELWDSMYEKPKKPDSFSFDDIQSTQSAPNVAPRPSLMSNTSNDTNRASLSRATSNPTQTPPKPVVSAKSVKEAFDDWGDDWGDFDAKPAPAAPAPSDLERAKTAPASVQSEQRAKATTIGDASELQRPSSMSISSEPKPTPAEAPTNGGYTATPAPTPAPAKLPEKPPVMDTAPLPTTKKSPAKPLADADDFFADFGL